MLMFSLLLLSFSLHLSATATAGVMPAPVQMSSTGSTRMSA